jgi:hypothetical protein
MRRGLHNNFFLRLQLAENEMRASGRSMHALHVWPWIPSALRARGRVDSDKGNVSTAAVHPIHSSSRQWIQLTAVVACIRVRPTTNQRAGCQKSQSGSLAMLFKRSLPILEAHVFPFLRVSSFPCTSFPHDNTSTERHSFGRRLGYDHYLVSCSVLSFTVVGTGGLGTTWHSGRRIATVGCPRVQHFYAWGLITDTYCHRISAY